MTDEIKLTARRWMHRRRMAYSALAVAFVSIGAYLYTPDRFQSTEGIFGAIMLFLGGVVSAYVGFSTWDDVRARQPK